MVKLLLLSVLVMMVVIPVRMSHTKSAAKGLRQALFGFLAFNVVYWLSVVIIYFTIVLGRDPGALLHSVHD